MDTMQDKMEERWFDGTSKIMVVTAAFGPGNDYPLFVMCGSLIGGNHNLPQGSGESLGQAGKGRV